MKRKGFTLIELLVVIAIIALLSSVVLASLNGARARGRDAQRMRDIGSIRTALELYRLNNSSYPVTPGWQGTCSYFGSLGTTGSTGYIPNLAPTYIKELPVDPKPVGTSGCYIYRSDGIDYLVMAYGTFEGIVPDSLKRPAYPTEKDAAYFTPGAVGW